MPSPILIGEEIQANQQRREHAKRFIHLFLKTNNYESNEVEVKAHFDLWSRSNIQKLYRVYVEVISTPFVRSTGPAIEFVYIVVGNPLKWSALPMGQKKRICSSFDNCAIPIHECLFAKIGPHFPFSDFELVFLKHLKIDPLSTSFGVLDVQEGL